MARTTKLLGSTQPYLLISGLSASPSATFNASDDAQKIGLVDGEGEPITFSERAEGIAYKALSVGTTYSGDNLSLWQILDQNAGRTGVTVIWGPHGNSVPASGKPVFTFNGVTLPPRPNLETEQSANDAVTFESVWQIDNYTVARV